MAGPQCWITAKQGRGKGWQDRRVDDRVRCASDRHDTKMHSEGASIAGSKTLRLWGLGILGLSARGVGTHLQVGQTVPVIKACGVSLAALSMA